MSNENQTIEEFINETGHEEITKQLDTACEKLEAFYQECGDPEKTYEEYNNYKIGKFPLIQVAMTVCGSDTPVPSAAKILEQLAYCLINSVKQEHVREARNLLSVAEKTFERLDNVEEVVMCRWLTAITHKQDEEYDFALRLLDDLCAYAEEQYENRDNVTYEATVLLPQREIAVIKQDPDLFDKLVTDLDEHVDDAKERFFTMRRAFECYCNQKCIEKAEKLYPSLLEAYEKCSDDLYDVYEFALKLNLYQYHEMLAEKLYEELKAGLDEKHLHRYAHHLAKLHAEHHVVA